MAIKDPLMFITVQEFKSWNGFNKLEFDEITTPDNEIFKAISIASNNIDYLSGFNISKKWPEKQETEFTDEIQTATAYYVNFLLTKDVNYLRKQASISQGGITYSENNQDDPYFIVPEVFSCLRKINNYLTFKGFSLPVQPYKSNTFIGNGGQENILEKYLQIPDLETNDSRVEIKQTHPKNRNTVVIIDTNNIKSFDNLTTKELFQPYFSNDSFQLVDGKQCQQEKVISLSDAVGESLWEVDPNSPNIIQPKEKRIITSNNTRIVYIADPTQPQDAVNLRTLDKKLKETESKFHISFQINAISQEIPNLETTDKTVAGAINEINKKQNTWQEVGTKININHIKYAFKENTKYKIYYNFESQTSSKKFTYMCKEFLYGELNTNVQALGWDKVNDKMIVSLQMQNDIIYIVSNPVRYGQLLKLEELQE